MLVGTCQYLAGRTPQGLASRRLVSASGMASNTDFTSRHPRPRDRRQSLLTSETKFGITRIWLPKWLTRLWGFCSMTPTLGNLSQPCATSVPKTAARCLSQPACAAPTTCHAPVLPGPIFAVLLLQERGNVRTCSTPAAGQQPRQDPLGFAPGRDPLGFAPAQVQIRHRSKGLEAFRNTI